MWLIWHRALAVNEWCQRININLDSRCPVCIRGANETVLHRFWECPSAQVAWRWGMHILNMLVTAEDDCGPWRPFSWKHGIFSERIPGRFNAVKSIWSTLRGTII
jgi:hypothetical protein